MKHKAGEIIWQKEQHKSGEINLAGLLAQKFTHFTDKATTASELTLNESSGPLEWDHRRTVILQANHPEVQTLQELDWPHVTAVTTARTRKQKKYILALSWTHNVVFVWIRFWDKRKTVCINLWSMEHVISENKFPRCIWSWWPLLYNVNLSKCNLHVKKQRLEFENNWMKPNTTDSEGQHDCFCLVLTIGQLKLKTVKETCVLKNRSNCTNGGIDMWHCKICCETVSVFVRQNWVSELNCNNKSFPTLGHFTKYVKLSFLVAKRCYQRIPKKPILLAFTQLNDFIGNFEILTVKAKRTWHFTHKTVASWNYIFCS